LPDCLDVAFDEGFNGSQCVRIIPGQKSWKDYERPDLRQIPQTDRIIQPEILKPSGTRIEAVGFVAKALGVSVDKPLNVIETPIDNVAIRLEWLYHLVEKQAEARERYANFIVPTLTTPYEIWLTAYDDGPRHRYIGLFQGINDLMSVVRINKDGSLLWNIMQAKDKNMNKMRVGSLLWGK
jgi:hypothetical protein